MGQVYRMPETEALLLDHILYTKYISVMLIHIRDHLLLPVPDHEYDLLWFEVDHPVEDVPDDRLACDIYHGFRLCVGMRKETRSGSGSRDDYFHSPL